MLVCNVSLRPPRVPPLFTAGIVEAAAAADTTSSGTVFSTIVDDPAAAGELLDAYLGEIMREAASAADTLDYFVAGTDPTFSSVVLLAGWEGANGATTYSEEKNSRAVTFASGARISTAQLKFGSSCFDYNGGNCSLADNVDWKLSSANSDQFCIEMWLRPTTATPGTTAIIGQDFGIGDRAFYLATTGNELEFQGSADGGTYVQWAVSSGLTWAANTWYHVAVSKDAAGKVRLFRDGVMLGSSTPANSAIFNSTAVLNFGSRLPIVSPWPGFMDETRITKGAARYSSDSGFTPPTTAFPRS